MVQNGVDQTQNFLLLNFTFWILSKTIWIRKHILDGTKLFTKYFYLMNPVWNNLDGSKLVLYLDYEGQKISKAMYGVHNSSKKRM